MTGLFISATTKNLFLLVALKGLFDDLIGDVLRTRHVMRELHRELATTGRHGTQVTDIAKHLRQRTLRLDANAGAAGFLGLDHATATVEVTDDITHIGLRREDVHFHDRLQQLGTGLGNALAVGCTGSQFISDG